MNSASSERERRTPTQIAPPIAAADLAHERVDPGAEDVADDEEQQHPAGDRPAQLPRGPAALRLASPGRSWSHRPLPRRDRFRRPLNDQRPGAARRPARPARAAGRRSAPCSTASATCATVTRPSARRGARARRPGAARPRRAGRSGPRGPRAAARRASSAARRRSRSAASDSLRSAAAGRLPPEVRAARAARPGDPDGRRRRGAARPGDHAPDDRGVRPAPSAGRQHGAPRAS